MRVTESPQKLAAKCDYWCVLWLLLGWDEYDALYTFFYQKLDSNLWRFLERLDELDISCNDHRESMLSTKWFHEVLVGGIWQVPHVAYRNWPTVDKLTKLLRGEIPEDWSREGAIVDLIDSTLYLRMSMVKFLVNFTISLNVHGPLLCAVLGEPIQHIGHGVAQLIQGSSFPFKVRGAGVNLTGLLEHIIPFVLILLGSGWVLNKLWCSCTYFWARSSIS